MSKQMVPVTFPDAALRESLEDAIANRLSDAFGVDYTDLITVRGQKKAIKTEAEKLYPAFVKALVRNLKEAAYDHLIDAVDDLTTPYDGVWPALDRVVDKMARNRGLEEDLEEKDRERRLNRLQELADALGYKLVEDDS